MLQVGRSKKFWAALLVSTVITSNNDVVYFHKLEDKSERGRERWRKDREKKREKRLRG